MSNSEDRVTAEVSTVERGHTATVTVTATGAKATVEVMGLMDDPGEV